MKKTGPPSSAVAPDFGEDESESISAVWLQSICRLIKRKVMSPSLEIGLHAPPLSQEGSFPAGLCDVSTEHQSRCLRASWTCSRSQSSAFGSRNVARGPDVKDLQASNKGFVFVASCARLVFSFLQEK